MEAGESALSLLIKTGLVKDKTNEIEIAAAMQIIRPFTREQIIAAYTAHKAQSPRAFTLADLTAAYGGSEKGREIAGHRWFDAVTGYVDSGADYITDDKRGAAAFKTAFGSLAAYGRHYEDDEPYDRRRFVETYMNLPHHLIEQETGLIPGLNHNATTGTLRVKFIGNPETCARIAATVLAGRAYALPGAPVTVKALPKQPEQERMDEREFMAKTGGTGSLLLDDMITSIVEMATRRQAAAGQI